MMMSLDTDEGSDSESFDKSMTKTKEEQHNVEESNIVQQTTGTLISPAAVLIQPLSAVVPQSLEASSLPILSTNLRVQVTYC